MNYELSQAHWFKSSRSETHACVEVAHLNSGTVGVRDSKDPAGPALVFSPAEWDAFTTDVGRGALDRA